MFLLSIWATGTMYMNFDEKQSPNVLENQTRLQNSAYVTTKSLNFRVLCALFEHIPSGINRDILKNPTWCEAKNSNKLRALSHLVTWIPHTASDMSITTPFWKLQKWYLAAVIISILRANTVNDSYSDSFLLCCELSAGDEFASGWKIATYISHGSLWFNPTPYFP